MKGGDPAGKPSETRDLLIRLFTGTFNYGIGSTLPLIIGFFLIPVYTAFLTPEDYGIAEVAALLGTFVALVMRVGVPGAVARFYYDHAEGPELRDYITTVAWFLRRSCIVVGLVTLGVGFFFIEALIPGFPFFPYVPLVVLAAAFATNSDLQRRLVQARRQSSYSAKLSVASASVGIGVTVLLVVVIKLGAFGMVLARTLTSAIFLVQATRYLWPDLGGRVRRDVLKATLRYGRSIFPSNLMGGFSPLATRSLLAGAASIGTVGLLALATRLTTPLTILATAFSTAYVPEYFSARKEGSDGALRAVAVVERAIWTIAIQASLATALLGPPVVLLLTPERFHGAAPLVPVLTLAFLGQTLYALMSPEMFYCKKGWLPPLMTASNIVTTIGLTLLTVGRFGAFGVAWSTFAGLLAGSLVCILLAARHAPVPHDWPSLLRGTLVGGLAMAVAESIPKSSPLESMIAGIAVTMASIVLLCVTGDPTARRAAIEVKRRLSRKAAASQQGVG